jgi:hypothetical protein
MKYYTFLLFCLIILVFNSGRSQTLKALFDNTKNETAGQADWIIDTDQPVPLPAQSGITSSTAESYWLGGISAWGVDLVKKGFTVHTLTTTYGITYGNASNPYDLSNYNLFIVCEPQGPFSAAEKLAIRSFVQNGGGLMMVADHNGSDRNSDGWDSPKVWNDLGSDTYFGIHFQSASETDNNISQVATNIATASTDSIIKGPAGNVTAFSYHNGTTMNLLTANNATAAGHIWMNGATQGTTKIMAATARYGLGKVAGVGDSSPADDGSGQSGNTLYTGWTEVGATDNLVFLNMCLWLTATTTVTAPSQVVLNSPANLGTDVAIPTIFKWLRTQNITNYQFQLSTSNTFSSFITNDSTLIDTTKSVSGLSLNATYYWKVRAKNSSGWGSFSTIRSFATWNTPTQVQLVSPSDVKIDVPIPSLFMWNKTQTATKYQIDVSTTNLFTTLVSSDSTVIDTFKTISGLTLNTTYYWRVRAKNVAGWGSFSAIKSFTTWNTPTQVQLVSPSDAMIDMPIPSLFMWNKIQTVTKYQIDVSTTNLFTILVSSDSTVIDTFKTVSGLILNTIYYWRVRAKNVAGWGSFSTIRSFTTWDVPSRVTLISPPDSATGLQDSVTFVWESLNIFFNYQIEVSTTSTFDSVVQFDSTLTDTTFQVANLDTVQNYFWRVRAKNNVGWGNYSVVRTFNLSHTKTLFTTIQKNWNIVSVPLITANPRKISLFPTATSSAFAFDGGYIPKDTLMPGVGYWLKFDSSQTISLTGTAQTTDTLLVKSGWNLIGTLSNPISTDLIVSIPAGIISSNIYGYDDGYQSVTALLPFRGYWIKVNQQGKLILR